MHRWPLILITLVPALLAVPTIGWAAEEAEAHEAGGLWADLPLWSLLAFVLFVWTFRKLLWGWASSSLAEREQRENELIAQAEEANRRAQQALRERRGRMEAVDEEVGEVIAEAHRDAEHTRKDIVAVARREAETLRQRAVHEIDRTREQALDELFATMADRVVAATQKAVSERMAADEHERLIDEALQQFAGSVR